MPNWVLWWFSVSQLCLFRVYLLSSLTLSLSLSLSSSLSLSKSSSRNWINGEQQSASKNYQGTPLRLPISAISLSVSCDAEFVRVSVFIYIYMYTSFWFFILSVFDFHGLWLNRRRRGFSANQVCSSFSVVLCSLWFEG